MKETMVFENGIGLTSDWCQPESHRYKDSSGRNTRNDKPHIIWFSEEEQWRRCV